MTFLVNIIFSFFSSVTFGIITNVPRRALLAGGVTGSVGWMIFLTLQKSGFGIGFSNFMAALIIGCLSIIASRKKRMPMIIFIIPSLVPLVPGAAAYKAVREFVLGDLFVGLGNLTVVIITAGAIAGGFMITSVLEEIIKKAAIKKHKLRTKK